MIVEQFCEATIFKNTPLFQFMDEIKFEDKPYFVHGVMCMRVLFFRQEHIERMKRHTIDSRDEREKQIQKLF